MEVWIIILAFGGLIAWMMYAGAKYWNGRPPDRPGGSGTDASEPLDEAFKEQFRDAPRYDCVAHELR